MLDGVGRSSSASVQLQLAENVLDMGLGGALGDEERLADLTVGEATREQAQDFTFPWRQAEVVILRTRWLLQGGNIAGHWRAHGLGHRLLQRHGPPCGPRFPEGCVLQPGADQGNGLVMPQVVA